jgi:hypothetical protein
LQAHFGHQGNVFAKTMIVIDGDVTIGVFEGGAGLMGVYIPD